MAEAFSASESEVEPAVSFAYIDYKMFRKKGIGIIHPELAVTAVSDMPPIGGEDAMQSAAELLKRLTAGDKHLSDRLQSNCSLKFHIDNFNFPRYKYTLKFLYLLLTNRIEHIFNNIKLL